VTKRSDLPNSFIDSPITEVFGDPISIYTRDQALEDGTLIDVSAWAGSGPDGMLGGFTGVPSRSRSPCGPCSTSTVPVRRKTTRGRHRRASAVNRRVAARTTCFGWPASARGVTRRLIASASRS
jgi:hypothetical protein